MKFHIGFGEDRVSRISYIGAYPMILQTLPKSDYQKMTFAVGRIRKCTLKLKLLVFLFCSPEVGLSYHVKCADRSVPSEPSGVRKPSHSNI